jgi:hypothetical protein
MTIERTTLPRQWALLKALPVYPRKISIRQLWNAMDQLGYEVTKRTIERDLINLSQQFGIVSDEAKPAGWSVMANDHATSRTADLLQPIMKPVLAPMAEEQNPKDEPEQDSEALDEWIQSLDPQGLLRLPQHHPEDFIGREWLLNRIDTWLETEHSKL